MSNKLIRVFIAYFHFFFFYVLFLLIMGSQVTSVKAQANNPTSPIPNFEPNQPTLPPALPPSLEPNLNNEEFLQPTDEDSQSSENLQIDESQQICIKGFDVVGSTVFSTQDLRKAIYQAIPEITNGTIYETVIPNSTDGSCDGIRVSFEQILEARSAIAQLYIDYNYLGTVVYVPEDQEIVVNRDPVRIQILEGEVEEIRVRGNDRLQDGYISSRLAIAASPPLNQEKLLEGLRLLQYNPLIENVAAELSVGSRPGQAVLDVQVLEADSFHLDVSLDNDRSPDVGSFRRAIAAREDNLLGLGDRVETAYRNTDGSYEWELGYTIPVNAYDGTLSFKYSTGQGRIITPLFEKLDLRADYRSYNLTFRQPVLRRADGFSIQELALGIGFSRQESETSILGFPIALSPGGDQNGSTRISTLNFFQEWQHLTANEAFFIRSEFNFGVDWFNASRNPDPFAGQIVPDSDFFRWRGQAQWYRTLAPDWNLLVRGNVQLADRVLVPFERFAIGGQGTVRGYRKDIRLADNGFFTSAELQMPIYQYTLGTERGGLWLVPFIDFGLVWNSSGLSTPDPNTLVGIGLGLQWRHSDRLYSRLDWGFPLVEVESGDRTWQENGIYFTVRYNFF